MKSQLPIRTLTPDFGGVYARCGFAYQDHAAVQFCLMMLGMPSLNEVWCETHDDIVLVWETNGQEVIEFVQVKAEEPDQLWSIAKLCTREKTATRPNGEGTSILEKSLARDNCAEETKFRLVTARELKSELELLKLQREHPDRYTTKQCVVDLCKSIYDRIGNVKSPNGNDHKYWVEKTQWECHELDALKNANKVRVFDLLDNLGVPGSTDAVDNLYEGLLAIVKHAAEQPRTEMDKKMIKKEWLCEQVRLILNPYPNLKYNEALSKKLKDGGLDDTYIETAKDLRRQYNKEIRQSKFLESSDREYLETAVMARLLELRSKLDSGTIQNNGVAFHESCLENLRDLCNNHPAQVQKPPEGFLQGCMYEITARCKHRFVKLSI